MSWAGVGGPERLAEAGASEWDIVVVGGGAIGTAVARAAARAGLRVVLLEAHDLGCGTTSRSTRLIHGGLRYLPMFDFGLVREDLREREVLLETADHLVKPIRFLYPLIAPFLENWPLARLRLWAGMVAYDVLSFDKALPRHRLVDRSAALRLCPPLDSGRLHGGALFYDAQIPWAERLCVEQAFDATRHGATCLTHVRVERVERRHGRVTGVLARGETGSADGASVALRAARVINTAGPWVDELVAASGAGPRLQRLSKGIHLVGPPLDIQPLIAPLTDDPERVLFVLPWAGATLVGTTDTPFDGDPSTPRLEATDVEVLGRQFCDLLPGAAGWRPWYGIAGIRSLGDEAAIHGWRSGDGATSAVSRRPVVVDHRRWGAAGLFSLAGGKLTGHRAIAGQLLGAACPWLPGVALLPRAPLPGAGIDGLPPSRAVELYGVRADEVTEAGRSPVLHGLDDVTMAELENAVRAEGARSIADVVQRRLMIGHGADLGHAAARAVAGPLAGLLGWDRDRTEAELRAYDEEVAERRLPAVEPADAQPRRASTRT